jgi:hypothetical protein
MADETAVIRMNPEKTLIEIETPDGEEWGPLDWPADNLIVCAEEGQDAFVAVLEGYDGLKSNTVYQLVEVATLTEEAEIDPDGDDDDDGPDDGEEVAAAA